MKRIAEISKGVLFGHYVDLGGYWSQNLPALPIVTSAPPQSGTCRADYVDVPESFDRNRLLSEDDWQLIADQLEVNTALIKAIAHKECRRVCRDTGNPIGFITKEGDPGYGKPIIRIEPGRLKKYGVSGYEKSLDTEKEQQDWDIFTSIERDNPIAAICSTSFGLFQLLGQEYLGYTRRATDLDEKTSGEQGFWITDQTGTLKDLLVGSQEERKNLLKSYTGKALPEGCGTTPIKQDMSNEFKPYCQYTAVLDLLTQFKNGMMTNEKKQAEYFVKFVKSKGGLQAAMQDAIYNPDDITKWERLARLYNGGLPGYAKSLMELYKCYLGGSPALVCASRAKTTPIGSQGLQKPWCAPKKESAETTPIGSQGLQKPWCASKKKSAKTKKSTKGKKR